VLIENFRPGSLTNARLDFESLHTRHPRLIYASISGFGQTGPRRNQSGYDAVMQAEGGLMSITGEPAGQPVRLGVAIVDLVAGLFAVQGVLLALRARDHSGCGQYVDVSLFDSVISLLTYHASAYLNAAETPVRTGNRHATIAPYDLVSASDGEFFLAIGNDDQFRRFCLVAGLPSLPDDPRFGTNPARVVHYEELRQLLSATLMQRPRDAWLSELTAADVPCGAVRDIPEVFDDPQLDARRMVEAIEHLTAGTVRVLGMPVKMSATPASIRTAPPTLGQHTDAVLTELGVDGDAIARLRAKQIV
jgi:formyl-CoA transferase/CoA:oxalate CoA-transferase